MATSRRLGRQPKLLQHHPVPAPPPPSSCTTQKRCKFLEKYIFKCKVRNFNKPLRRLENKQKHQYPQRGGRRRDRNSFRQVFRSFPDPRGEVGASTKGGRRRACLRTSGYHQGYEWQLWAGGYQCISEGYNKHIGNLWQSCPSPYPIRTRQKKIHEFFGAFSLK